VLVLHIKNNYRSNTKGLILGLHFELLDFFNILYFIKKLADSGPAGYLWNNYLASDAGMCCQATRPVEFCHARQSDVLKN
jgi:hypothetical protein